MSKDFKLSAGMITVTEIFLENIDSINGLREGLYFLTLEYLEKNIDVGTDNRVRGNFLRDFNDLLEFLFALEDIVWWLIFG